MNDKKLRIALRRAFIPLASILLRNGLAAKDVVAELKTAFVVAAQKEFGNGEKPASVSKIARLTGMSRRYVSELVSSNSDESPEVDEADLRESAILSNWVNSGDYVDEFGVARVLDLGPGPGSFYDLVKSVTGDDNQDFYLKRLISVGSICVQDGNKVQLANRVIRARTDLARLLSFYLTPVIKNIDRLFKKAREEGFVLRVAHSDRIAPDHLGVARRASRERVIRFIEDMDDVITALESDSDTKPRNEDDLEVSRVGVIALYFELERD